MQEIISKKLDEFFLQYKHQLYKKDEILIRADDAPSGIFYLKKGTVRVYAITKSGQEFVITIYRPLSFFPMSWAITHNENKYYYDALEDVEVWKAPKEPVLTFLKNNPEVLYDLVYRIYQGLDGFFTRMAYLMTGNAYSRLIAELLIAARRNHTSQFVISEKELAAQTGLTRETISRELKILKNNGLMSYTRNIITIKNITALEHELDLYS